MSNFKNDLENYHKMCEPHESIDAANEALKSFYQKVEEARKEFKIADILVVTSGNIRYPDGDVGQFMQHSQYGSQLNGIALAAYAYGKMQAEHKEVIGKIMSGKE